MHFNNCKMTVLRRLLLYGTSIQYSKNSSLFFLIIYRTYIMEENKEYTVGLLMINTTLFVATTLAMAVMGGQTYKADKNRRI
jgi:hypothetical protein